MTPSQRRTFLRKEIQSQKQWIVMCGGDLAGYIAHYGTADDPDKYGDGGEAIYKADTDHLNKLETDLAVLEHNTRRPKNLNLPVNLIQLLKRRLGTDVIFVSFNADSIDSSLLLVDKDLGCRFEAPKGRGAAFIKALFGDNADFETIEMDASL